jgi:hypothetical protein
MVNEAGLHKLFWYQKRKRTGNPSSQAPENRPAPPSLHSLDENCDQPVHVDRLCERVIKDS